MAPSSCLSPRGAALTLSLAFELAMGKMKRDRCAYSELRCPLAHGGYSNCFQNAQRVSYPRWMEAILRCPTEDRNGRIE